MGKPPKKGEQPTAAPAAPFNNPFAKLGLRSSRGLKDVQPPNQAEIARFVALADELTPPSFAAYLDVAVHEGMRPGELDALRMRRRRRYGAGVDCKQIAPCRQHIAPPSIGRAGGARRNPFSAERRKHRMPLRLAAFAAAEDV